MDSEDVIDLYAFDSCCRCAQCSRQASSNCVFQGQFALNTANNLKCAEIQVSEGVAITVVGSRESRLFMR